MKLKNRISKVFSTRFIIVVILISGLFYSCNPEKKLAKQFVYQTGKKYALLFTPDYLIKINQKTWLLDSIDSTLSDYEKDSILWEKSDFVKNIDDSIFLIKFTRGYAYRLAEYGFDVYGRDYSSEFFNKDSNAYVINIPQIELEETVYPFKDETILNGYTYFHQHYLNALSMSTWFEINKVNDTTSQEEVMFAGDIMTDDLESNFKYDEVSEKLKYFYKIDTLTVNQVYDIAITLGKRYASYTYDYLLNKYILKAEPQKDSLDLYWHYDLEYNKLYPVWKLEDEERLIPVDN